MADLPTHIDPLAKVGKVLDLLPAVEQGAIALIDTTITKRKPTNEHPIRGHTRR